MQLLPTFIIVSLLAFFIVLTTICILWHWRRSRIVRKRRPSDNSYKTRSTRHLTVEGTKVVNVADVLEKGLLESEKTEETLYGTSAQPSKRKFSLPASIHSPRIRQASVGSRNAIYGGPQIQDIIKVPKKTSSSSYLGSPDTSTTETAIIERSGSLTLPRPALINIERRGSGQSSRSKKSKRRSLSLNAAQPWYGRTPSGMAVVVELPASPVTSEKASVYPNGQQVSSGLALVKSDRGSREASGRATLSYSPTSLSPGSGHRVTFAQPQYTKSRFSSSTVSPGSSASNAPRYSSARCSPYKTPPPRTPKSTSPRTPKSTSPKSADPEAAPKMVSRLDRPPSLDVDIPHVAPFSFFNASSSPNSPERPTSQRRNRGTPISSPTSPHRPSSRGLHRTHSIRSVMSSRSVLTIASSEISSNWTIGDAQAVDITPCIGPDEQAEGSVSELEGDPVDRQTPPYAKTLRSKYGRYPRGRRDKALPVIPRSPLSKSFGLDYGGLGRSFSEGQVLDERPDLLRIPSEGLETMAESEVHASTGHAN